MNRLRVKSAIVSSVRLGVEKRASQIRKRLTRRVATLALKCRWRRWNVCVRATYNTSGIRFYSRGRILISLRSYGPERAQTELGR